jgi:hypothetical protein
VDRFEPLRLLVRNELGNLDRRRNSSWDSTAKIPQQELLAGRPVAMRSMPAGLELSHTPALSPDTGVGDQTRQGRDSYARAALRSEGDSRGVSPFLPARR